MVTNKIAYITPSMGGFKAGYSIQDSGDGTTDTNAIGASYTMPIGGGSMLLSITKQTKDGATDTDTTNYGCYSVNYGCYDTYCFNGGTKEIARS